MLIAPFAAGGDLFTHDQAPPTYPRPTAEWTFRLAGPCSMHDRADYSVGRGFGENSV
jgi:hypothetical protein